jgi:hypothetical protein
MAYGTGVLTLGLVVCQLVYSQSPANTALTGPELMNQEAAKTDPAGIYVYCHQLIELIVPEHTEKALIDSLSHRLTAAELAARGGKGKLVSEGDVTRAFNELMKRAGAPSSYMAEDADIRAFRLHAIEVPILPALLTAARNDTKCNPGEAVYLVSLLIGNNGKLPQHLLDSIVELRRARNDVAADTGFAVNRREFVPLIGTLGGLGVLSSYSARHHPHAVSVLFNDLAKTLNF